MFENNSKTTLDQLGEIGLIAHLNHYNNTSNNTIEKGVGDDAAVIKIGDEGLLISSDMLVENVHFDLMYTPLMHLGYKTVVTGISDICAMNGKPTAVIINISISSKFTLEAVEDLYKGIYLACDKYQVQLIGGDTSSSVKGLTISVTAIGKAKLDQIAYRDGAKEKDLVCVSGDLGSAYLGLQLLEREKKVFLDHPEMQPDLEGKDYVVGRQLRPEARVDIIELFDELNIKPTSMIDISDGLASEILHLCEASGLGVQLFEEKIPIDTIAFHQALEFNLDPTICALNGGEDYELLFTISQKDYDKIKGALDFTIIGYMDEKGASKSLITKGENIHPIIAQGWEEYENWKLANADAKNDSE